MSKQVVMVRVGVAGRQLERFPADTPMMLSGAVPRRANTSSRATMDTSLPLLDLLFFHDTHLWQCSL